MTFLVHTLMGITIGETVHDPAISFAISVPVHILVDKVPHYWPENKNQKLAFQFIDFVLTLLVIHIALHSTLSSKNAIIAGIAGSLFVDFLLVNPVTFKTRAGQWHTNRQPHIDAFRYIYTDAFMSIFFAYASKLIRF